MRHLKKPTDTIEEVLDACITTIRDQSLKKRFNSSTADIAKASKMYQRRGGSNEIEKIKMTNGIGDVSGSDMAWLYNNKMVPGNAGGREYYDRIMLMPEYGICPICGVRDVGTLDHYLPVSRYPAFAVYPMNLIPCCEKCNKLKSNRFPSSAKNKLLHPYYDKFNNRQWLYASLIEASPMGAYFYVKPPRIWGNVVKKRLQHHFDVFKLNVLYASKAGSHLASISRRMKRYYDNGGADVVKQGLKQQYIDYRLDAKNSWETALYKALAKSTWYHNSFCEDAPK